jgi:polyisoprenoid-binding protein YceI
MMYRILTSRFLTAAIATTLLLAKPLPAQQPVPLQVTLALAQTSIHWTLDTTLHTVHGTFTLKSGSFRVDPATGDASGLIVIDATSGESGDSARDTRMHKAILESERYPEITYRPAHVSGRIDLASGGDVTVDGTFNLHGADHPLQLTVHLQPQSTGVKLSTHFSIPFVAWGLKDPSTFVFRTEKEVVLDVNAIFTPALDHTPARPGPSSR